MEMVDKCVSTPVLKGYEGHTLDIRGGGKTSGKATSDPPQLLIEPSNNFFSRSTKAIRQTEYWIKESDIINHGRLPSI
jgi:hypothetical protein